MGMQLEARKSHGWRVDFERSGTRTPVTVLPRQVS